MLQVNTQWYLAVNELARDTPWAHPVLTAFARYGVVVFAVLLVTGLVLTRRAPSRSLAAAGWAGVATPVAVLVNQPLVRLFAERRPYVEHPAALVLVSRSTDPSFPSDHAVMAGAATAGLFLVSRRLGLVSLVLGVLMAFARVYVGVHYPGDVVAGLLLGALVLIAGWLALAVVLTRLTSWLRRGPVIRTIFAPGTGRDPAVSEQPAVRSP